MHLQCLPIKNYGYAGYVDDPLPNIVYITPIALYSKFSCIIRVFLHFSAILYIPSVLCGVFRTIVFFVVSVSASYYTLSKNYTLSRKIQTPTRAL